MFAQNILIFIITGATVCYIHRPNEIEFNFPCIGTLNKSDIAQLVEPKSVGLLTWEPGFEPRQGRTVSDAFVSLP